MIYSEIDKPFMVYGYCRVSREEKLSKEKYMRDNEGRNHERIKTIDEQRKLIEDYAKSKNWNEVRIYSEETTTPRLRRHLARESNQFCSMFSECKENDVIVISSADRLFGEVREAKLIISKLKSFNIQLFIVDIDEDITKNDSYKILTALLDAFIERKVLSAVRRRSFDNQMGSELSFRGGFDPIGFKSEMKDGRKVFKVNEEEKEILEEILKFKELREEEKNMRKNQVDKFESADPKKYTIREIEKTLNSKFKFDEKYTRTYDNGDGRVKEIKRFSHLTIHRLITKDGYVEQKLSMIKRLENLTKKDKN